MEKKYNNLIKLIRIYIKEARGWFFIVCISTLVEPLVAYIDVEVLKVTVDSLEEKELFKTIFIQILLIFVIYIGTLVINSLIEIYFGEVHNLTISNHINKKIYKKIIKIEYAQFEKTSFYDRLAWALNNYYNQTFAAAQIIWRLLMAIFTIGTLGALILTMDYRILLFVVLIVVLIVKLDDGIGKTYFNQRNSSIHGNRVISYIVRTLSNRDYALDYKCTRNSELLLEKYENSCEELLKIAQKYRKKATFFSITKGFIECFYKCATLLYLANAVKVGDISLGEFTALFFASSSLKVQLEKFGNLYNRLNEIDRNSGKINEFFDESKEEKVNLNGIIPNASPLSIEFCDVYFRYRAEDEYVLKGVSFKIKAGEKVALVGENGSGKSTIIKLILGLYRPTSGTILINGHDIEEYNMDELRNDIGCIFQNMLPYAFSIIDNVRAYNRSLTEEEVLKILESMFIDDILKKNDFMLESAITYELDDKGVILSGGELQAVLNSRVFTKKFSVLILDEPTSFQDAYKRNRFNKKITESLSTVIYIGHDFSYSQIAENIICLKNGKLTEIGNHKELLSENGYYYSLYMKYMQSGKHTEQNS